MAEHIWNEKENVLATCLNSGVITYICEGCETTKHELTPATTHSYGEWQLVLEATEHTEGVEKQICTNCNDEQTRKVPKKEHEHIYEGEVTSPTCTEKGFTLYTCACGDFYISDYTDATDHT